MHRKSDSDLFPQDTKLVRTLRKLRKISKAEIKTMADEKMGQTEKHEITIERVPRPDTMEDFWRLVIQEEYSAVRRPTIEANNFELKPTLITMVQQHQFTSHPT